MLLSYSQSAILVPRFCFFFQRVPWHHVFEPPPQVASLPKDRGADGDAGGGARRGAQQAADAAVGAGDHLRQRIPWVLPPMSSMLESLEEGMGGGGGETGHGPVF